MFKLPPAVPGQLSSREEIERICMRNPPESADQRISFGIAPERPLIVTEDLGNANREIESLAALGVRIALDDFATGYSTLARLREPQHEELVAIGCDAAPGYLFVQPLALSKLVAALTANHQAPMTLLGPPPRRSTLPEAGRV